LCDVEYFEYKIKYRIRKFPSLKNSFIPYFFPHLGGNARVRNVGGRQKGLSRRGMPALAGGVVELNSAKNIKI